MNRCRFWQTAGGCRYGEHCRFLHELPAGATPSPAPSIDNCNNKIEQQSVEKDPQQKPAGKRFQRVWRPAPSSSSGGGGGGEQQQQLQQPEQSSVTQQLKVPVKRQPQQKPTKSQSDRDQELAQLRRRFADSFQLDTITTAVTAGNSTQLSSHKVSLSMQPTDPDFPFDLPMLNIQFTLPGDYPLTAPSNFRVLNAEIPTILRLRIERYCSRMAVETTQPAAGEKRGKLTLLQLFMQRLDRELERLLVGTVAGDVQVAAGGVVQAKTAEGVSIKLMGRIAAPVSGIPPSAVPPTSLSDVSSADEHEEDEAAAAAAANDIATIERQQPEQQQQHQPQLHGTQIKLMGVHLRNIGVIECSLLSLLIECKRCRTKVEWKSIRPYSDADGQCEKCKTELRLRYSPALAYPGNEVVGTVDTDQCLAVELLRSTFQPTCSECTPPEGEDSSSPVTQMEMQAHPCMPPILACFPCVQCHARMEFGFSGVRFTRLGRQDGLFSSSHSNRRNNAVDEQQQSVRRRKNKQPREPGIVPGQPLPDKGTCSHYKKSFRWLRFPCCGRAFPCDICHQDQNKDGHEMKLATRMICGHCSREQRLVGSTIACVHCGTDVIRSAGGTGYWEGGAGTRDQTRMSRNDSRKFRGLHKTASKKSERVGQHQQKSKT